VAKIKPLRENVLFKDFTDKEIAVLSKFVEEKNLSAPTPLFLQNMKGESMFIIGAGRVKLSQMLGEGEEKMLGDLGPGDFFGELALIENGPRAVSAIVIQDSQLLVMKRAEFERMMEEAPKIAVKMVIGIYKSLSDRIRSCSPQLQEMIIGKAGE